MYEVVTEVAVDQVVACPEVDNGVVPLATITCVGSMTTIDSIVTMISVNEIVAVEA